MLCLELQITVLIRVLASAKSYFNVGGAFGSGVVFLGLPFAFGSGVASGMFVAAFAFAFGSAFAFALGSAAPLEDAPPLSAGAAAFLDAVFGLTSSIVVTLPFSLVALL